jgi:hypothetical protein
VHRIGHTAAAAFVGASVSVLTISAGTPAASADGSGTVTVSVAVNVPVRSLTVSTTSLALDQCKLTSGGTSTGSTLQIPGGYCSSSDPVTITLGSAPSVVDIAMSNVVPSDGGQPWTLCLGACTSGSYAQPGPDEATMVYGNSPYDPTSAVCDPDFNNCQPVSSVSESEELGVFGPTQSTDQSAAFSQTTTWTAVP